jgi:hypothetical protein
LNEKGLFRIFDLRDLGFETEWSFIVLVLPVCIPDGATL